jgi:hypothetical protein
MHVPEKCNIDWRIRGNLLLRLLFASAKTKKGNRRQDDRYRFFHDASVLLNTSLNRKLFSIQVNLQII